MLTVKSYCFDLELFFGYLDWVTGGAGLEPEQVDPADIVGFLNTMIEKRGNKSSTRNRKLAALRSYFGFLKLNGLLNGQPNPIKQFQGSKINKLLPIYFTPEEVNIFLENCFSGRYPHRDYAMFLLVLQTGCRISEILGLKIEDFNLENKTVRVTGKGNKERQLPLTEKTCQAIQAYLDCKWRAPKNKNEQTLFLSKDNRPISTRGIQKRFEHICKKAGLLRPGLSIHKLRHTCLSLLLQEGVDLPTLQLLAGHEEIGTTAIYLHVSPQQAESAVEMHPLNAR